MLQKRIQQQQKAIQYIKNKYKQKTGEQIILPKKWQDYLLIDEDQTPIQQLPSMTNNKTKKHQSFQQRFNSYQLPSRISYTKPPFTNFSATNPFHMIQYIQLNNLSHQGFSKITFRQLLNRIVEMRCLKAISLNRNNIDDTYAEEIDTLFNMKKITRIDLSRNNMGKTCLQIINKNFNHIEWLENNWIKQIMTLQVLVTAIRTNTKLFHICLDLQQQRLVKQLVSYLKVKTNINSFSLIDSKYDPQTMNSLCQVLQTPSQPKKQNLSRIINLNFTFCYLQPQPFSILLKSLSNNNTLISLNLSNNQLLQSRAIQLLSIVQVFYQSYKICLIYLQSHLTLMNLNLSNNQLEDKFAQKLADCLKKNQIIQIVNIEKNNISDIGAKIIYQILNQHNDTLQSLGNIQTNQRISVQYLQKIYKALRINKISKDIRAQLTSQQNQLTATEIANRQTQAFLQAEYQQYQLLQPIAITNSLKEDTYKLNIWNL